MRRVCLVFVILAVFYKSGVFAQEFIVDGIKYNVTSVENRTVEVISNGMNGWKGKYSGDIVIPSTVNYDDKDYNVTKVGERAFWFCADVTSFVIPNTITRIENEAFAYCWNAGDIQVPENVKYIGDRAFYVCSGIRNIRIPMTVTHIGEDAFALFSQNDSVVEDYYIETIQWNCNLDFSCLGKSFIGDCNNVRDYNVRKLIIGKDVTKFTFCDNPYDDPFYESRGTLKKVESIEVNELNSVFDCRDGCNAIINTSQNKLIAGINNTIIPATVTRIGEFAFMDCEEITSIDIPAGVTSIDDGAFCGCRALESFTIPSGVTTIGYRTFLNCGKLETITIPASLTGIGSSAFEGCSSLITEISIPADMTVVPSAAFRGCSSLTSVTIPSSVTRIEDDAFYGCESLTDITIPEGVTDIRYGAFSGCKKISSLYIPSSVSSISIGAFNNCDALESIVVAAGNTTYDSRNDCKAIIKTSTNELVAGSANTVVPSGVTIINYGAFSGRTGLEELVLPVSLTSIGSYSFTNCINLENINIPDGVTDIGTSAFEGCEKLSSIEIPNTVTSIGNNAFNGCYALTTIELSNSITNIDFEAFAGCESLETVIIKEGVESIRDRAFAGCINLKTLYVPSTVTYIATNAFDQVNDIDYVYWNTNAVGLFTGEAQQRKERHIGKLVIGKDMTEIQMANFWGGGISHFEVDEDNPVFDSRGDCDGIIITASNTLFKGCINTRIPNSVTAIGDNSLEDIYDLETITIPNSVTTIGGYSFAGCNNLTSLIIPSGVTSIGDFTFFNCSSLTSINLPIVTSIGDYAFFNCSRLASINFPNVISIGSSCFSGCSSLTAIIIPASVTDIGNDAFKSTGLESIVVDAENTVYDSRNNCNAIIRTETNELLLGSDNTVIPEGVERIKGYAFSGCSGLSSVFIPSSVTYIEDNAFEKTGLESIVVDGENDVYDSRNNCNAVIQTSTNTLIVGSKKTIIPSDVVSIKNAAFRGYAAIETISIPDRVSSIGWSAFRGCSSLASVYVYSDDAPSLSGYTVFGENAAGRKFYVFSDLVESYRNASGWNNYYVDDIEAIPALTANNAGGTLGNWCTYYNGMASVKMPDDVIIYKASIDGERIVLTQVDGHIVSKGEAVLLNTNNSTIVLESAQGMIAGDFDGNSLRGVDYTTAQDENKTYYVLSKKGDDFGFYKLNPEVSLSPNKAYLEVDNRSLTQIRTFYSVGSTDGLVDGMLNINSADDDTDGWYTIYGTKLNGKPVTKGLYIHNGQKVVVE